MIQTYEGFINNSIFKIKRAFTIGELSRRNDNLGQQIYDYLTSNKVRVEYSIIDTNHKFHVYEFRMKFRVDIDKEDENNEKKVQVVGEEGYKSVDVQISIDDASMKIKDSLKLKIYNCFVESKLKLGINDVDSINDEWC